MEITQKFFYGHSGFKLGINNGKKKKNLQENLQTLGNYIIHF